MTSIDTFVQITTTSKPDKRVSKRRGFGATVRSFPYGLALAWLVLATVLAWAFLPWLFTAYDPLQGIPGGQLKAPSAVHLLGTDPLGRDLFARIVYGAVHSLTGAIAAVGVDSCRR